MRAPTIADPSLRRPVRDRRRETRWRDDLVAVQAGLTLRHSDGQTEGQVGRLKLLKRQGYGRAKVDLLRQRVLRAA